MLQQGQTALPPGPSYPRPLQTIGWIARPGPFLERCRRRYGDIFTLKVAHEGTWVMVADPNAVEQVFKTDPTIAHAGEGNHVLSPILGRHSVLLLDEQEHMTERRLLLPPFHGKRIEAYREAMRRIAEREVASWPIAEPLALWPRMQAVTLETIMRTVFGVDDAGRLEQLRRSLAGILAWPTERGGLLAIALLGPGGIRRHPVFRRRLRAVDTVVFEEIARRRRDPAIDERTDILSLLTQARYEDGTPMSDRAIRDELITLLIAGHETTATALAWALERLLRHPDKLERLRAEGEAGGDEYLDAVVKETLRLRPVLPIVARRLKRPHEIGGYRLPAGVSVTPCIYLIHRRPDVYPEPGRFRPERFLERPAGTYTWIPFGGGVRRCLGASFAMLEMRTVLPVVLQSLSLQPADARGERVARRAITLVPGRGARAVVAARRTPGAATRSPGPSAVAG